MKFIELADDPEIAGHDIAVEARQRVMQRHRVLNLMTHVDPWRRPDLDHAPAFFQAVP